MSGKNSTSSSSVNIPPSVLAQYNSVIAGANQTAQTPFQTYSGVAAPVAAGYTAANAGSFVAPTNAEQSQGTSDINAAAAPITGQQINQYLSPYLNDVLGSTEALQNQSNQQAQAGQLGDAIRSGSFGSDRTGIAAANLQQQLNLANSSTIAGIANQGYQTAQGEANTEQAAQLAGGEQEIGAGTVQQQTQQAEDTAEYNQFQQQQSYPFQVGSWLAGISEGTGSLSGSTTTTTQPGGFFSDRRLKRDIKKIGKTFDGQDVVSYKMGDDDRTRIGLIAQDVEKKHPHAVGLAGGFKVVDYGKATQKAANEGHFAGGGVVAFRRHRDAGGGLAGVLEAQRGMYAGMPGGGQRQIMAAGAGGGGHGLAVAQTPSARPQSGVDDIKDVASLAETGQKMYDRYSTPSSSGIDTDMATNGVDSTLAGYNAGQPSGDDMLDSAMAADSGGLGGGEGLRRGGVVAFRRKRDAGGSMPYGGDDGIDIPDDTAQVAPLQAAKPKEGTNSTNSDLNDIASIAGIVGALQRGGVARRHRDAGGGLDIPDQQQKVQPLQAAPAGDPAKEEQDADMQDIKDVAEIAGVIAMLNRGGTVGRRGYDDGGAPTDDTDDSQSAPPPASGIASAPATDDAPAPSGGGLKGFWEKYKGDILPALAGIGAMGTARTVHPGVALAAGLEAAAENYPKTQEGLAAAGLTQEQAKSVGLANAVQAAKNKVIISALQDSGSPATAPPSQPAAAAPSSGATPYGLATGTSPSGAPAPAAVQLSTGAAQPSSGAQTASDAQTPSAADTAAAIDQSYRNRFYVNPAGTAAQQAAIARAKLTGYEPLIQKAEFDRDNSVQAQTSANRNVAQGEADQLYAAATDPNSTDTGRAAAMARYNALHQWTGDTYGDVSGSIRNSRTGETPIGVVAQTLTPQQQVSAQLEQRGQNIGSWSIRNDANGNPYAFNAYTGQMRPLGAAGAAATGSGVAPSASTRSAAASVTTGAKTPVGTPSGGGAVASGPTLPGLDITKLPRTPQQSGFATTTSQIVPGKTQEYKAQQLQDLPTIIDQAARNSATYAQLQSQLAKADPHAYGPSSSTYKAITGLKTYLSGLPPDGLVNQAEVDKYLNQMGVMGSRQLIGEGQPLRQQEMLLLMSHANPNIDQPLQVIRNLAAFGQANNDFDLRAGNTTLAALQGGADPYATAAAISNRRPSYVQQRIPQVTAVRTGKSKGHTVVKYADGHLSYVD